MVKSQIDALLQPPLPRPGEEPPPRDIHRHHESGLHIFRGREALQIGRKECSSLRVFQDPSRLSLRPEGPAQPRRAPDGISVGPAVGQNQHVVLPPQQRGVGLLFQNYALFPNMTVEQNVLCGLKAEKDPAARRVACAEMLRAMRLETLAKRYPAQLSGGQQQRAALARILVGKPHILMLDEPFSALDSYLREEVEGEVGSLLANFAGTALLVTHNRDEAYRLCKEMIVLNEGQVLRTGSTKAVFADPQSIAAARLTGCKNILPCTPLDSHTVRLDGWSTTLRLALPVPAGCTAVGIRAHDFTPCAADAPNAIPVKAVSTSENPFDWNLI